MMWKAIIALFAAVVLFVPTAVHASNYGECSYGEADYGNGCNSTPASAPECHDQAPGPKTPWLYGAIARNSSSVLLYFTEADNPVTKYLLEYGVKSGEYQFGVQDLGINERNQMTYQVNSLSPNTTYYFKVRGQNGCATGNWSNEISVKTKGLVSFNQLNFIHSEVIPVEKEKQPSQNTCESYIVKSGDSLWMIAKNLLGDGNRYQEIIEQNKETYPSLASSNSLDSGWELRINCATNGQAETEKDKSEGLDVNIRVVNAKKQPVKGAKVILHSEPKEAVTDKNGVAKFTGVESGEHKVLISYFNYKGEQSIFLTATGNQKEFDINITIEPKNILLSTQAKVIIGILLLIVVILFILLLKAKKRSTN